MVMEVSCGETSWSSKPGNEICVSANFISITYKHFTSFLLLPAYFLIQIGYHLYRREREDVL